MPPQNVLFLQLENERLSRDLQCAKENSGLALQAVVRKANHEIQCLKDDLKRDNANREQLEALWAEYVSKQDISRNGNEASASQVISKLHAEIERGRMQKNRALAGRDRVVAEKEKLRERFTKLFKEHLELKRKVEQFRPLLAQAMLPWEKILSHLKEMAKLHEYQERIMGLPGFLRPRTLEERREGVKQGHPFESAFMHYDKESLSMPNILGKAGEGQTSNSETVTVRRDNVHRSQERTFNTEEPAATVEGSNETQTRPPTSEDMPAGRMPTQIGYDLSAHKSRQIESRSPAITVRVSR